MDRSLLKVCNKGTKERQIDLLLVLVLLTLRKFLFNVTPSLNIVSLLKSFNFLRNAEAFSEHCQTCKIEHFAKIFFVKRC